MQTRSELEQQAQALLDKYQVTSTPVAIDTLARGEGLPIVEMEFRAEVSGALMRGAVQGIAVNAAHHVHRRRFTIAHELAHYLLEHEGEDHIDWQFTVIRRDGTSSEATDYQEIEANFFAASLLMPKQMIRADIEQKKRFNGEIGIDDSDIQALARKYLVSEIAMKYRLMNLGLLPIL